MLISFAFARLNHSVLRYEEVSIRSSTTSIVRTRILVPFLNFYQSLEVSKQSEFALSGHGWIRRDSFVHVDIFLATSVLNKVTRRHVRA